jgi:hypothetical protein
MTTRPVTELATSETVDGEPRAPDVGVSTPIRTFLVAVSVYLVAVVAFGLWMSDRSGGHFTYALDDPYIHLAMADNLAFHGTWGVDPGVYESASSSPAWTVLTAAGMIVLPIPDLWVPLVLNVAAGAWIIWQIVRLDPFRRLGPFARWGGLVALGLPIGIIHVTFVGMEHLLHAALALAIVVRAPALFDDASPRQRRIVLGLIAAATLVRIETGFLAVALGAAVVVAAERSTPLLARLRRAAPVVAASVVPVALVAGVNLAFGQYPLPNSVTIKTGLSAPGALGVVETVFSGETVKTLRDLVKAPEVTILLVAIVVLLALGRRSRWTWWHATGLAVLATAGLTVLFGDLGWFGRYNVWLVGAAYGVLLPLAADPPRTNPVTRPRIVVVGVLAAVLLASLSNVYRASSLAITSSEIYRQHRQTARFLADNYAGEAVAVNDLGYVAWQHDGHELDLWGLASIEVVRAIREQRFGPGFMADLVARHDVRVVVIYAESFEQDRGGVPGEWTAVERWCLDGGPMRAVGRRCVTWYGPTPADAEVLRRHLAEDRDLLPDGVTTEPPA